MTKDHLVSKPVHSFLGQPFNRNKFTRLACKSCNKERGEISNLYRHLRRLRSKQARGIDCNKEQTKFFKNRTRLLPHILKFKTLIVDSLPADIAALCLVEIKEVMGE